MLETTERIRTKCQALDADCSQTQGAKYDNKFQWSEEKKTNPTSFWAERDFFAIIPTASSKAITQPDFYFGKCFGYFFLSVVQL